MLFFSLISSAIPFLVPVCDLLFLTLSLNMQERGFFCFFGTDANSYILVCVICCHSRRVRERRASGSREMQVLPQGAYGHVRQPSAVAQCGQRGKERITAEEIVRGCISEIAEQRKSSLEEEVLGINFAFRN